MKKPQTTTGKGNYALRDNWSTYVSLLKADLVEQEGILSGLVARSGKGELSLKELRTCANASGRVSNLRNLLQLIGESNHE